MKQLKKLMAICVIATTVFCAGCSGDTSSKASTDAKTGVAAKGEKKVVEAGDTLESDSFSVVVPKGWQNVGIEMMEGAISIAKGNDKSMNVAMMEAPAEFANITAEEYKAIVETNVEVQKDLGITLNKTEVQTKPYGDIVYAEVSVKVTQELIDQSLSTGMLTQEAIDVIGGTEAYMKNMSMEQICAYSIQDGKILMVTAQVVGGGSLDSIKDEVNFVIDHITLK